jgi:hypothetical protein
VVAVLGAGGMGQVYLALSPGGRHIAVKVIRDDFEGPEALARFRREVATVQAVHSPFTAALVGAGLDAPPYWLATEYVPGPTLAQAVAAYGPLPPATALRLTAALAEALADVHGRGIEHRDLKPQNVILSPSGPKLIDFGIARGDGQTAITRTGMMAGTPGYLAPEVVTENRTGPAADVFALAGTAAFAATGRPPFGGGDVQGVVYRSVHNDIDVEGVEPGLAEIIGAAAVKDPEQRPTAAQVLERCAVRDALADDPDYRRLLELAERPPASVEEALSRGLVSVSPAPVPLVPTLDGTGFGGFPNGRQTLDRPKRARSMTALYAASGVVAVALVAALLFRFVVNGDGGGANADPGGSRRGGAGSTAPAGGSGRTAGSGGTAGTAAPRERQSGPATPAGDPNRAPTRVLRSRTGALPVGDLHWDPAKSVCEPPAGNPQINFEEQPPGGVRQDAMPRTPISVSDTPVQLGYRFKWGAPDHFYIAADVLLPVAMRGSAGADQWSGPRLVSGTDQTYFDYPSDFGQGPTQLVPGDYTVLWFHVHNADDQAYFIDCDGFTVK